MPKPLLSQGFKCFWSCRFMSDDVTSGQAEPPGLLTETLTGVSAFWLRLGAGNDSSDLACSANPTWAYRIVIFTSECRARLVKKNERPVSGG